MNKMHFLRALVGLVSFGSASFLHAQSLPGSDRVRVEVTVQSETERKNLKGTHTDQITDHKTLTVRLTGKPMNPETRLIRWTIYGRDLAGKKMTIVGTEEVALTLAAAGNQTVTSKRISITHTPDHILSHGKNREGGKVAADGVKYLGYAVQVRDGEKIVGAASDPPGVEKRR